MFLTIFTVCLALCQITMLMEPQGFPLMPVLIVAALLLLFLLTGIGIFRGARRRVLFRVLLHDLRYQAALFFFLLINLWQFAGLLSASGEQERLLSKDAGENSELYVYGHSSRDGILNYRGEPVNYLRIERVENAAGALFARKKRQQDELMLYGMEERYFKGQYLKLFLPRGIAATDRLVFLRQGLAYSALARLVEHVPPATLSRAALRREVDKRLNTLSPRAKSFVQSLILGYRSEMGAGLQELFRNAGVIHILVLSGMHLGIIYLGIRFLIPGLIPLPLRELLALGIMALYLWFINPGASAWRAALMVFLWTVTKWSGWKTRPDNMLSLIWTLLIVLRPRFIFDIGIYLSFAAIWGLIHIMPIFHFLAARFSYLLPLHIHSGIRQFLLNLFIPSLSAQAAVNPITLLLFGSIAPQGLLALPLVLPLFYFSLIVSALLIPVLFWAPGLGIWLNTLLDMILDLMSGLLFPFARIARILERWPGIAKAILCCIPLAIVAYCRFRTSLLSSGHVQLRFRERDQGPAPHP